MKELESLPDLATSPGSQFALAQGHFALAQMLAEQPEKLDAALAEFKLAVEIGQQAIRASNSAGEDAP